MSLGLVQELFSEVGDVKRCSIHYDPSGRSKVCVQLPPRSPALHRHTKETLWQGTILRLPESSRDIGTCLQMQPDMHLAHVFGGLAGHRRGGVFQKDRWYCCVEAVQQCAAGWKGHDD
jgi:hypothetical protein